MFWLRGITRRITGVIALLCVGFVFVSFWELDGLNRRMMELHHEAEAQAGAHLEGLLNLESQPVRTFAASYSWWDELVTATGANDQAWLKANIDPALRDYQLDAAIVIDSAGRLVHAAGISRDVAQSIVADLDVTAIRTARTAWLRMMVDGGVVDVAGATIHPTADTQRTTEPRGLLIGVRRWSSERMAMIAQLFGGSVDLDLPGGATGHGESDATDLHVHREMHGRSGQAIATMHATRPMSALRTLKSQTKTHLLLSASFGACALLLLSATGLLLIGRPLKQLASCVQSDDADLARVLARRHDELGLVAHAVAQSIERQSHLSVEVAQRRQAEDSLRDAEMRNSLALQGGNLCLWELFLKEGRWAMDRSWLSFLGVSLDPSVPDTTAWESVIAADELHQVHDRVAAIRSGENDRIESTFRVRRDDGGRVWVLLRGMVVERDADGQPLRLAGTMLDVTRWREMEEQLRQSQKLESIGQLAAGIAHEINTPIQFIGDNTRFAADSFVTLLAFATEQAAIAASHPDEKVRAHVAASTETADFTYLAAEVPKALEQTLEGVDRVATIVRAMKEFSHPGSAELTPCDLNHLVENAVVITRSTWKYVADLSTEFDAALPLTPVAVGDFNQVLLNLIVNAAHAVEDAQKKQGKSPPGKITIATARVGDQAVLRISDDGCGIPEDIRERIYDPFFTTKEVGRGSGQGLTLARSIIVDRHHGHIDCESTVGKGTVFIVTLPLIQPES